MKKLTLILLSLIVLSACSSKQQFGNFTTEIEDNHMVSDMLALDIAKQISTQYIPAKTKFQFVHENQDNVGQFLQQELRLLGFAVGEYEAKKAQEGIKLSYIVDNFSPTQLVVRVHIDNKTMSRLYKLEQSQALPASSWSISTMEL